MVYSSTRDKSNIPVFNLHPYNASHLIPFILVASYVKVKFALTGLGLCPRHAGKADVWLNCKHSNNWLEIFHLVCEKISSTVRLRCFRAVDREMLSVKSVPINCCCLQCSLQSSVKICVEAAVVSLRHMVVVQGYNCVQISFILSKLKLILWRIIRCTAYGHVLSFLLTFILLVVFPWYTCMNVYLFMPLTWRIQYTSLFPLSYVTQCFVTLLDSWTDIRWWEARSIMTRYNLCQWLIFALY